MWKNKNKNKNKVLPVKIHRIESSLAQAKRPDTSSTCLAYFSTDYIENVLVQICAIILGIFFINNIIQRI